MDNTAKRKYLVDPVPQSAFRFHAPKELVDRNDVIVCVEYLLQKGKDDNCFYAAYWVWCHFQNGDTASMVYKGTVDFGRLCGLTIALESSLLNAVLQSPAAVKAIQRYAGVPASITSLPERGNKNDETS